MCSSHNALLLQLNHDDFNVFVLAVGCSPTLFSTIIATHQYDHILFPCHPILCPLSCLINLSCSPSPHPQTPRSDFFDQLSQSSQNPPVQLINRHSTFPVITDTGATITISPNCDDFDPRYTPTEGDVLQGLTAGLQIECTGTIQWALHLDDGSEVALSLPAYHVQVPINVYSVHNISFNIQRIHNILSST